MLTRKGEAAPALTGAASTPKCDPQRSAKKTRGVSHSTPECTVRPVLASPNRHSRTLRGLKDTAICLLAIAIFTATIVIAGMCYDAYAGVTAAVAGLAGILAYLAMLLARPEGRR